MPPKVVRFLYKGYITALEKILRQAQDDEGNSCSFHNNNRTFSHKV
jgi:hypothetical protein